jgi:hypothetical protein
MNQEQLNEEVYAYFDIEWGLSETKRLRENPIYVDHDITPTPLEYHAKLQGQNPICIIKKVNNLQETFKMNGDKIFSWKNYFIRLYRKVRGYFK